jgi:anti-sigma factor RsiW
MNCIKFEEMVSDYVDGLLAQTAQGQFAEHALSCRTCRALLDDVKSALGECKQAYAVETPFELDLHLQTIPVEFAPLDCFGFEELITEFLDGFVPASTYHKFEEHEAQCEACSRLLTGVVYAVAACHSVHTYEEYEVPKIVADNLLEIMPERRPSLISTLAEQARAVACRLMPRATTGARWSFATGSALAFATFAILLFGFSDDQTISGIYRQAHVKVAELYSQGADIYAHKDEVVGGIQKVGSGIGEIWETIGGENESKGPGDNRERDQNSNSSKSSEAIEKN